MWMAYLQTCPPLVFQHFLTSLEHEDGSSSITLLPSIALDQSFLQELWVSLLENKQFSTFQSFVYSGRPSASKQAEDAHMDYNTTTDLTTIFFIYYYCISYIHLYTINTGSNQYKL